jgi:hypothetical protein
MEASRDTELRIESFTGRWITSADTSPNVGEPEVLFLETLQTLATGGFKVLRKSERDWGMTVYHMQEQG